jgi:hypothetical protein
MTGAFTNIGGKLRAKLGHKGNKTKKIIPSNIINGDSN